MGPNERAQGPGGRGQGALRALGPVGAHWGPLIRNKNYSEQDKKRKLFRLKSIPAEEYARQIRKDRLQLPRLVPHSWRSSEPSMHYKSGAWKALLRHVQAPPLQGQACFHLNVDRASAGTALNGGTPPPEPHLLGVLTRRAEGRRAFNAFTFFKLARLFRTARSDPLRSEKRVRL